MGWYTKPAEKPALKPTESLWAVCRACNTYVPREEWVKSQRVCPRCNFHDRMTCRERVALVCDEGSFSEINAAVTVSDPLQFVDASGAYADKAKATVAKTGEGESVLTGTGTIEGIGVVLGVMDFRFLGGSLASGTGERILLAAEEALKLRKPLIIFSASGGARMHEGIISLMQMAKTCAAINRLQQAGVPFISVLTDPTTGGVSASYAMVGDINIAEPKALIGFAGRRVIEQTIKQKLPDDFQTAEYMLEHGFLDHIVSRSEMKAFLANVLRYATNKLVEQI
ncbi:MAG: acetyl-CoA carboxylase carboxyltransferase subunit beta [Lentisphaerae bacterium]|jgi:acetyl-CoA carboxylase carboxyl transferase subunit beta|nr:acetyl-CoA carboxylase carboxyltransferase subunit beta [Lentisphaerota bacterium]